MNKDVDVNLNLGYSSQDIENMGQGLLRIASNLITKRGFEEFNVPDTLIGIQEGLFAIALAIDPNAIKKLRKELSGD